MRTRGPTLRENGRIRRQRALRRHHECNRLPGAHRPRERRIGGQQQVSSAVARLQGDGAFRDDHRLAAEVGHLAAQHQARDRVAAQEGRRLVVDHAQAREQALGGVAALREVGARQLELVLGQRIELGVRIEPPRNHIQPDADDLSQNAVDPSYQLDEPTDTIDSPDGGQANWPAYFLEKPRQDSSTDVPGTSLNRRYTFDTFIIGASNRFAHAAALAIAEAPARAYNPLFIWGESGLGKTHLLHAAGNYAQRLFPGMRVKYVSTEEFTNDFINSLRDDRKVAFKRSYRDIDVLLVDDIQFIEGKEGIQEEFFHTFNTLHNANKQIVISSDRPPKQLATLEDRLRTRFEWGLITDVQPPELETRIAILRKKAQMERLAVPDDVLELIATSVERNIRELEGALIRVTAFASLNRTPIDTSLAEIVLRDLLADAGTSILVSTHYMDEAERCHRIAYISYGHLIARGTVAEVVAT